MFGVFKDIKWKIMIPVMLFAVFQVGFQSFATVLANIASVFPNESPTLIQTIMTIPSLMTIPVSLLAGLLASYMTKKTLVLFALGSMFAGGMIPLAVHSSVYYLIISSAFIGIGQGFLISIASAILAEHFDGVTRGTSMGLKQAASSIGQAALTILTGYLCLGAWYKAYYVYFLVIPVIVLVTVFLPKGKLDQKLVGRGVGLTGVKNLFTPTMIYMSIVFLLLGLFYFTFYTNIAMSITSKGLGDASAIGIATAFNNVTTILIGLILGYILRLFKKFTMALALIIIGAGYFVLAGAPTLSVISLGGIIFGIGAGIQMPSAVYYVTESVSKESSSLAIAISMALVSVGVSISPVVVNSVTTALGGKIDGTTGLYVAAAAYMIMFAVEVIREVFFNKNSKIGIIEKEIKKGMNS